MDSHHEAEHGHHAEYDGKQAPRVGEPLEPDINEDKADQNLNKFEHFTCRRIRISSEKWLYSYKPQARYKKADGYDQHNVR